MWTCTPSPRKILIARSGSVEGHHQNQGAGACETKLGEVGLFSLAATKVKVTPTLSKQIIQSICSSW